MQRSFLHRVSLVCLALYGSIVSVSAQSNLKSDVNVLNLQTNNLTSKENSFIQAHSKPLDAKSLSIKKNIEKETTILGNSSGLINHTVSTQDICYGDTVKIEVSNPNNVSGDIIIYDWLQTEITRLPVSANSSVTFREAGLSPGYFLYYVSFISGSLSTAKTAHYISISNNYLTKPTGSNVSFCKGDQVVLTATGSYIHWYSDANFQNLVNTGNTLTINNANNSQSYYVVSQRNGCRSQAHQISAILRNELADPIVNNVTICESQNTILSTNSSYAVWYSDSALTNIVGSGLTFETPQLYQTTTYYVANHKDSCTGIGIPVTVTVNPTPAMPIAENKTICAGESATLTASASGDILWFADAALTILVAATATFNTPALSATTNYYVVNTVNGCASPAQTVTVNIVTNNDIVTTLNAPDSICFGEELLFNITTNTNLPSVVKLYDWTKTILIDQTTTNNSNAILRDSGMTISNLLYYIQVNTCGDNTNFIPKYVFNNNGYLQVDNATICAGENATLTASASGDVLWFADAALTIPVAATATFNTPILNATTNYYVVNTVNGCASPAQTVTVTVNPTPTTPIVTNQTINNGQSATLTASASGDILWFADTALTIPVAATATFNTPILNTTTNYYVVNIVNGCASLAQTVTVTVMPVSLPTPTALYPSSICRGNKLEVNVNSNTNYLGSIILYDNTGYNVIDSVNGVSQGIVSDSGMLASALGYYISFKYQGLESQKVFFIVYNNNCYYKEHNNSNELSLELVQSNKELVLENTIMGNNNNLCIGDDLILQTNAIEDFNYLWKGPKGLEQKGNTLLVNNIQAEQAGVYELIVMKDNDIINRVKTTVEVQNLPTLEGEIKGNNNLCEGQELSLQAPKSIANNYYWEGPNAFQQKGQVLHIDEVKEKAHQGVFTVKVIDEKGCTSEPLAILVNVNKNPNHLTIKGQSALAENQTLLLSVANILGATYQWTMPNGATSNKANISIANFQQHNEGVYTVDITIGDCQATLVQNVEMIENKNTDNISPICVDLITPNGDGINDTWVITNLQELGNHSLSIFARSGVEVYSSKNYTNDWNATFNNEDLAEGTYWYILKLENGSEYRGAISIKR